MLEQHWATYVGAIGGLVGAISGVGGLVVAILAYRCTSQIKALDLRLELRKCECALRSEAEDIAPFLEQAKKSHTRLAAAQGMYQSGAMEHWLREWESDLTQARSLAQQVSELGPTPPNLSQARLEERLTAVRELRHKLTKISSKYRESLTHDDAGREQLHADQRAIMQARMEGRQ